jgi:hypothetical protein
MTEPKRDAATALGSGTYEIIRGRLQAHGATLRERMAQLDARRREVFGSVEFKLLQSERVTTAHNCVPRDMVQLGEGRFLFGFNVQLGLKREVELGDVFAIYRRDEADGTFKEAGLEPLHDKEFLLDFRRLYTVYEKAAFSKFSLIDGNLYLVFQTGAGANDIAVCKWAFNGGQLRYVDGRAEAEYRQVGFPPQFEFRWRTPERSAFRYGAHPHVSIEDRVFVECIGGTLTVKVEDNTASGTGIYEEPVDDRNQKVDDAEIAYAIVQHLVLLKIRPYKETAARYFIFNEKQQSVVRVDSLGQSCALLPEDHGLIFPDGYYLATGVLKRFESKERDLTLERVIHAANGEDSLYVFYARATGDYVLLPYRLIAQKVEERVACHGFSLFANGHLILFRADAEAQKHHTIQLRQTPFVQPGFEPEGRRDAFLFQVGNKEVVRCLAEINEVLTLIGRENPYPELYDDVVRRCGAILDAYPWLKSADGFALDDTLRQVRETADKAVEEFDKVRRLQRDAVQRVVEVRKRVEERTQNIRRSSFRVLQDFVQNLSALRQLRGELITLKELRYVDVEAVTATEAAVAMQADELAKACVKFLLQPAALDPYRQRADQALTSVDKVVKVAEGRKIEQAVASESGELELLIEIVNGLKIDDATEATRIIDSVTAIYSTLNQVKAALKNKLQSLASAENAAQFAAQMKLLGQSAASFLDLCTTPAKCDEYLNRVSVQLEELEGAFADFPEYTVQITDKRTALYEAFEQRKLALVEQRNRKTAALMSAAERVLKTIQNRLGGLKSVEEIHAYMAADVMIAKVRDLIAQLLALDDSVKADDLQGRLKSVQQEAVRQLKDRQELFVDGTGVIQLGKHRFNVNTQPLDLTVVLRDGVPHLHLTSTKFFEPITEEDFLATRGAWEQEVVSETAEVYRAEYLAAKFLESLEAQEALATAQGWSAEQQVAALQAFMAGRYDEGYTKGVHDLDAAKILRVLLATHVALQLARYAPTARSCAVVYWHRFCAPDVRGVWTATLKGFAERNRLFPGDPVQRNYITALQGLIGDFVTRTRLFAPDVAQSAGEYLFHELISSGSFVVSREADSIVAQFEQHLAAKGRDTALAAAREELAQHPAAEFELLRDWVRGFLLSKAELLPYVDEAAAVLFCGGALSRHVVRADTTQTIFGLRGTHAVIREGSYAFDYLGFRERLERHQRDVVPTFTRFHQLKQQLLERERRKLRLTEFTPRVLTSFVRNQLVDQVYLPFVGDNLAKQIGAAGAAKRTDLMGLLLLISPPGYGKTTLLEYVAHRLGVIFVKINGPAIGHAVTSLDPEAAPNAAAREELNRLNLAFEMGDNVMLCVDDIQHCNPEFLQKFISLCDGQRKIEGVWRGKPRTYDLRGRKVVVVMAGNPYTESGQKFKIPDMLANRADTYNLGDIIGTSAEWFKASYLENAVTSNAVLSPLANRSQKDIRAFIRMAEGGERPLEGFEGSYTAQELEEILSVLRKLVAIRTVILAVNFEYIHSAAQADEFRTEPPFRLQGSYRNMNRLTEKVVPVMNDGEVRALILDHYRSESQTLTTGAEANFLKFKELIGAQSSEDAKRWSEIKATFQRNQVARGTGADGGDPAGRVVAQLSAFHSGLQAIQASIDRQAEKPPATVRVDLGALGDGVEALRKTLEARLPEVPSTQLPDGARSGVAPNADARRELASELSAGLKALGVELRAAMQGGAEGAAEKVDTLWHELESIRTTLAQLKGLASQRREYLRSAQELLAERAKQGTFAIELTQEMLTNERAFLEKFDEAFSREADAAPKRTPEHDGRA